MFKNFVKMFQQIQIYSGFCNFFNKKLGVLRVKNKFVNVLHATKQILIQFMRAMCFLAAARAGFRNIYCFPVYVTRVSLRKKLLYSVSQFKLLRPVSAINVGYLVPENIFND